MESRIAIIHPDYSSRWIRQGAVAVPSFFAAMVPTLSSFSEKIDTTGKWGYRSPYTIKPSVVPCGFIDGIAKMRVLFLDTNIFLQCLPLSELPWGDLTEDDNLLLLIPRPVQEEIDHLKQDGNSRRAKRARKASAFLRELVWSSDSTITLRENAPRVQISFSPPIPADSASPLLDMSRSDDRILEELLLYTQEYPAASAALLTHDANPMLTAKRLNLEFLVIPERWLLPPEQDERDKRISELERRLTQYERSAPAIAVSVTDQNGVIITNIKLAVQVYTDLGSDQIEELLAMARMCHPIATDFGPKVRIHSSDIPDTLASVDILGGNKARVEFTYQAPSQEEIAKYQETEYPAWEDKLKSLFKKLAALLEPSSRRANIVFIVDNNGSLPAENVLVEFEALGGIVFEPATRHERDNKNLGEVSLPTPPKPPDGTWVREPIDPAFSSATSLMTELATAQARARDAALGPYSRSALGFDSDHSFARIPALLPPRDRNGFYLKNEKPSQHIDWENGRPTQYTAGRTFECAEFRHKAHSKRFSLPIFVKRTDSSNKGAITCTITAKNLPEPVHLVVPVFIENVQCDTVGKAKALIKASGLHLTSV